MKILFSVLNDVTIPQELFREFREFLQKINIFSFFNFYTFCFQIQSIASTSSHHHHPPPPNPPAVQQRPTAPPTSSTSVPPPPIAIPRLPTTLSQPKAALSPRAGHPVSVPGHSAPVGHVSVTGHPPATGVGGRGLTLPPVRSVDIPPPPGVSSPVQVPHATPVPPKAIQSHTVPTPPHSVAVSQHSTSAGQRLAPTVQHPPSSQHSTVTQKQSGQPTPTPVKSPNVPPAPSPSVSTAEPAVPRGQSIPVVPTFDPSVPPPNYQRLGHGQHAEGMDVALEDGGNF